MKIPFNALDLVRKKRNGAILSAMEIQGFIDAITQNSVPEYQQSAFLMAVYFQSLNFDETVALTKAMAASGATIHFHDRLSKVDKHSTGGIGDKVSIPLAPLVASCGAEVPMVAGRGLGHTGGTIDKLESIPGFQTEFSIAKFKKIVQKIGVSIMGQTMDFVPADRKLYALRDVTATVESIPLITASILSKKLAEGIGNLILDIKFGSGAFMKTKRDALMLARNLKKVGEKLGLKIKVLITDMNQPLGCHIGNALEIRESLDLLEGNGPSDLKEIVLECAIEMLILSRKKLTKTEACKQVSNNLQNGKALQKFFDLCKAQGVNPHLLKNGSTLRQHLPRAPRVTVIQAKKPGYIKEINGFHLGQTLITLGGGRQIKEDTIDHSVGFKLFHKIGEYLKKDAPLIEIHWNPDQLKEKQKTFNEVRREIESAFSFSSVRPRQSLLIHERF